MVIQSSPISRYSSFLLLLLSLILNVIAGINIPTKINSKINLTNKYSNNENNNWEQRMKEGNLIFVKQEPTDKNFLPSISNGYLGTVIDSDSIYVGLIYVGKLTFIEKLIGFHSERARIPSTMNIDIFQSTNLQKNLQQKPLNLIGSALDLERAMYLRRYLLNNETLIEQRYYAHRQFRSLLIHEIIIDNLQNKEDVSFNLLRKESSPSKDISFHSVNCKLNNNAICMEGQLTRLETPDSLQVNVSLVTSNVPSSISVKSNTKQSFLFFTTIRSSIDSNNPLQDAEMDFKKASSLSSDDLYQSHIKLWNDIWQHGIEIEGNPQLALQINSTLYYLLSAIRTDYFAGVSPGGISTNAYQGLVFWDQEVFVLPSLAYLYPDFAKTLLEYRFERLEQALNHAKHYKYEGAMYPFQTGFSGREVDLIALFNELEQHITGDIGFALELYWNLTKDKKWLERVGFPIAYQIALFWKSRVVLSKDDGKYHIRKVVGPDEFGIGFPLYSGVNDEVFTNAVAQISLRFANKAARILGKPITTEFDTIADKLTILFDTQKQRHYEYDNFPRGNTYFLDYVKQADIVLLGYPLQLNMTKQVRLNDVIFEQSYIWPDGPAMTFSMNTIAWLDVGNYSNAYDAFKRSLLNIQSPFNIFTETPNPYKHHLDMGSFNFLTGSGGFIQSIVNGFGGLRVQDNSLIIEPKSFIGLGVNAMKLRGVCYQGAVFDISFDGTSINNPQQLVNVVMKTNVNGQSFELKDKFKTQSLSSNALQTCASPCKIALQ
ncbi:hypothetical protein ABK040_012641 [Willaertia magna]